MIPAVVAGDSGIRGQVTFFSACGRVWPVAGESSLDQLARVALGTLAVVAEPKAGVAASHVEDDEGGEIATHVRPVNLVAVEEDGNRDPVLADERHRVAAGRVGRVWAVSFARQIGGEE